MTGSPAYENWVTHRRNPATDVIFEFPVYSDSDGVPAVRTGLGPYEILRTKREVPTLVDCPSLLLRVKRHVWPGAERTGDEIPDELASLLSLLSGSRLAAAANYSRRFGFDDDPLGEPIHTHETLVVPKPTLGAAVLPHVLTRRSWDPAPLLAYLELTPAESLAVAKAARLYRQALWYAEAQPEFCWLMLVSAAETAAGFWQKSHLAPEEQLQELRPQLATILLEAGGRDLLERASTELADYMGATRKFTGFIMRFGDVAGEEPSVERAVKAVYGARSKALHSGAPIPASMPMSIEKFENLVRCALLGWWSNFVPGGPAQPIVATDGASPQATERD